MIKPTYQKSYDDILEEQFKKAGHKELEKQSRKLAVDEEVDEDVETDSFDILLTSIAESLMKSSKQLASLDDNVKKSIAQDIKDVRSFMTSLFAGGVMIHFCTVYVTTRLSACYSHIII